MNDGHASTQGVPTVVPLPGTWHVDLEGYDDDLAMTVSGVQLVDDAFTYRLTVLGYVDEPFPNGTQMAWEPCDMSYAGAWACDENWRGDVDEIVDEAYIDGAAPTPKRWEGEFLVAEDGDFYDPAPFVMRWQSGDTR